MRVEFIKMHGLGHDFVVLDARAAPLPVLTPTMVRALADRNRGIGFDQLILLEPSAEADCAVTFYNADGSTSEACARDCEGFTSDPQMQRCARTCQDCARSCRDMAKMPL